MMYKSQREIDKLIVKIIDEKRPCVVNKGQNCYPSYYSDMVCKTCIDSNLEKGELKRAQEELMQRGLIYDTQNSAGLQGSE